MLQLLCIVFLFAQADGPKVLRPKAETGGIEQTGVDAVKFERIYREAKAVASATSVGVNYMKYTELIQSFAKEVAVLNDQSLSRDERAVFVLFKAALAAYSDSATIWRRKLAAPYDRNDLFQGGIPYSTRGTVDPVLEPLVNRYRIKVIDIEVRGLGFIQAISPDSVQIPWTAAKAALAEAIDLYMPVAPEQKNADSSDSEAIRVLERLAKPRP